MNVIKEIPESHYDEFVRITADAYPGMKLITDKDREKYKEKIIKQTEDPRVTNIGLYRNNKLLGGMILFDFRMNLFGQKVLAGGVGSVAVDFLHKKEHIARDMMSFYLDYYRKKDAPLLVLWPFRPDFYKAMGFGFGAKISQYRFKPDNILLDSTASPGELKKHIRFMGMKDIPALNACYNRYGAKITGMVEELEGYWHRLIEFYPRFKIAGFEKDGKITGYILFHFVPDKSGNFIKNSMRVSEFVYENHEAMQGLLAFMHSQFDQIDYIILNTPDDTFHHCLKDPRNDTEHLIQPVYHETNVCGTGIMYRILDVKKTFKILKDHNFNNQSISLKINIRDSFFPDNDGPVTVRFTDGKPVILTDDSADVEIETDIADFSSMFLGVISFRKLYEFRLAKISDISYLDTVNRLFWREEKPVCMTPF